MSSDSEPRTEAGKELVARQWETGHRGVDGRHLRKLTLAIETEATRLALEDVAKRVVALLSTEEGS